jgi:hypothetical protein
LLEHAEQTPSMQARPLGGRGKPNGSVLQSSNVEQGPQVPWMHACPDGHAEPGAGESHPIGPPGVQTPVAQVSPEEQSVSWEHVHCIPECVAWQIALGPH